MLYPVLLLLGSIQNVRGLGLNDNLAFHSPSLAHRELSVDTEYISKQLHRRSLVDSYLPARQYTYVNYTGAVNFTHNVASGDPEADSVILWTRIAPLDNSTAVSQMPVSVKYEVSTNTNFSSIVSNGSVYTTNDVDYTVKVLADNLKPWTQYFYRFTSGNETSPIGRAKTLPGSNYTGSEHDVNLAIFSCSNYPFGHFNAFGNAARSGRYDYSVHLGDYLYEYAKGEYDLGNVTDQIGRTDSPSHALTSLSDYRTRYKHYRSDPDLALNHQMLSWFAVWDDHEVADNSWSGGSADSDDGDDPSPMANGVSFTDRKASAIRAYYEYMPIRPHLMSNNLRLYRSFQIGQLADFILLDTRQRDRDLTDLYTNTAFVTSIKDEERRSMMGLEQESWFYDQLSASSSRNATWRIIGQQVVFSPVRYPQNTTNVDAWDGYTANRNRVLKSLQKTGPNNVVLAGDSHVNWAFDMNYKQNSSNGINETYSNLGMELAGTAVSSPTPLNRTASQLEHNQQAADLVATNDDLVFADPGWRGYFDLRLSFQNVSAQFFAAPNLTTRNSIEIAGPRFMLPRNRGLISRPVNNGQPTAFGALRNSTS